MRLLNDDYHSWYNACKEEGGRFFALSMMLAAPWIVPRINNEVSEPE